MHMLRAFAIVSAALASVACGSEEHDSEERNTPAIEETAFGEMVGTMDKARSVESTLQQQKESTDQAIEESEAQ